MKKNRVIDYCVKGIKIMSFIGIAVIVERLSNKKVPHISIDTQSTLDLEELERLLISADRNSNY